MYPRILALILALAVVIALGACASTGPDGDTDAEPGVTDPGMQLRLAPGMYDLEDGTVQVIGTLEYRDLEGGFYAVVDGTVTEDGLGKIIAVVNNADEFADELDALDGKPVSVIGTRFDGASIRMAGPEVIVETIEETSDTPGIAE
jgi:hypothetical protein